MDAVSTAQTTATSSGTNPDPRAEADSGTPTDSVGSLVPESLVPESLVPESLVEEELLVEEVSIDGMCGVY